jgi:hypothetical protein
MSTLSGESRLSADDRFELASRAAMHERQTRPAHYVVFGILIFVATLIFLAVAWNHNTSANKRLRNNQIAAINVERMIAQIDELELAQSESPIDDRFAPIPDILTRFSRIGQQMGLTIDLPRTTPPRTEGGARLHSYQYSVRDPSLEKILQWIQRSQDQIPGLRVREMTINLNAKAWLVKVTLNRYERIE